MTRTARGPQRLGTTAAVAAALLAALACAPAHADSPVLHWRMVGAPAWPTDAVTADERQVIRDRKAFDTLWKRLHAASPVAPPLPPVDFARESVIVVPLGQLAAGGTQITHERLDDLGPSLRLTYVVEVAGQDCMATQSATAPLLVLRTPRIDKPVTFVEDRLVRDCQ